MSKRVCAVTFLKLLWSFLNHFAKDITAEFPCILLLWHTVPFYHVLQRVMIILFL